MIVVDPLAIIFEVFIDPKLQLPAFNVPRIVLPAFNEPEVLIVLACNGPQLNDELVVFPVIILPKSFIINRLLLPEVGLMILDEAIVILPVVFPKITV